MAITITYTDAQLREVALTRSEYEQAVATLGREPNPIELGMIGAMWSEHCGYKNSKPLLRQLPTTKLQKLLSLQASQKKDFLDKEQQFFQSPG